MPRPNIRPWRDDAELLSVRHLLYPRDEAEHDIRYNEQRLGVNMVSFGIGFNSFVQHRPSRCQVHVSVPNFDFRLFHSRSHGCAETQALKSGRDAD